MDSCYIENFGLEALVERNDCEHCPFKDRSECKKAHDKVLEKANENYHDYMQSMNRKDRRDLTGKEKTAILKVFVYEEIKKLFKEMGVKLA